MNVEVMKYSLCGPAVEEEETSRGGGGRGGRGQGGGEVELKSSLLMNSLLYIGRCLIILVKPR